LFPDSSGDLATENFEPNWFLLEHHHATSFDDLKVGLAYLKRKVDGQKEGQLSFLKVVQYYVRIIIYFP
jgi:exocyst complex component 2